MRVPNAVFKSQLSMIPDGKSGVIVTLKTMRDITKRYKTSIPIRTLAVALTNGLRQKDWHGEIKALHEFVRDKIRYVRDITDVETLQMPDITLKIGAGDCDDKSMLLASLLESINHPTRFVAVGFRPDVYSHVYVESRIGNRWIPLETTEPVPMGWTPPNIKTRLVIHN